MYERGLGKGDPEKHIGQLADALLRDVRLLSAIGLHTKGMTVAQSEKMFREQAFQDPGNARQQAARGTYDPAYLNYTLGKLMIRKLRADWAAKNAAAGSAAGADDQASWHDFHDKFLSYGGPPIPLVRKEMLGEEGSLFVSAWRARRSARGDHRIRNRRGEFTGGAAGCHRVGPSDSESPCEVVLERLVEARRPENAYFDGGAGAAQRGVVNAGSFEVLH